MLLDCENIFDLMILEMLTRQNFLFFEVIDPLKASAASFAQ